MLQPQKCTFCEEVPKNLKKKIFPLMNTFYKFTRKIETKRAKKVFKSMVETGNVNDVIVYVWFIYFWIN